MEKEENYQEDFTSLDYSLAHHQQQMKPRIGETSSNNNNNNDGGTIDYMLNTIQPDNHQQLSSLGFCSTTSSTSFDKLSFADVMQFADFGSKLAFGSQHKLRPDEEVAGMDPVYFLKFPVLNDKVLETDDDIQSSGLMVSRGENDVEVLVEKTKNEDRARVLDNTFMGEDGEKKKIKKKRGRSVKTSEEVESQRMTHIAVERNRRKQMNEHIRVLRTLMPSSYVQRGDQASIIGGAIEFVRELEQLLQCLESQKRRRIFEEGPRQMEPNNIAMDPQQPPFLPLNHDPMAGFEIGVREETAESKSCLADIEVKVLGFDAIIKILSRRRPGQLIKTIVALEEMQLTILHTNITTIEQTVLYSFNVKVTSESRLTAEDIASSVQQIFGFIHANTSTIC